MLLAFSVAPSGIPADPAYAAAGDSDASVHDAVAAAVKIVRESGLPNKTDSMFTTIEGEWDEVMAVVKRAVDVVAEAAPRVSVVLKADVRPGVTGAMDAKVEHVERRLAE
jgi:uncharacterized protein (TIGR00106 family)